MKINFECVRALMLEIESTQTISGNGKPNVLHMRYIYGPMTSKGFSMDDCNVAVVYLLDKKLIRLVDGQKLSAVAPCCFSLAGITGTGYDYLAAVRKDTVWTKIKEHIGIDLASVSAVISAAAQIIFSSGVM